MSQILTHKEAGVIFVPETPAMMERRAAAEFRSFFPRLLQPEAATIGIEDEFPVVDVITGKAVDRKVIKGLFTHLTQEGWQPVIDQGTQATVAVTKESNGQHITIGTDVGYAILEAALPAAETLHEAEKERAIILTPIVNYLKDAGAALLGYGILPVDEPHRDLIAPKGRYRFFERDSTNTVVPESDGVDLDVFALSSAAQTHVKVDQQRALPAMNVLNSLAGTFMILGANSPIWRGELDSQRNRATREWFWNVGWPNRRKQVGYPGQFRTFEDYISHIASFRPQMIKAQGEYLSLMGQGESLSDLLSLPEIEARTVNDEIRMLIPNTDLIHFANGFAWYPARVTPYGTVESRVLCQQPPGDRLATAALTLGIVTNLQKALYLTDTKPPAFWIHLRTAGMFRKFIEYPDELELIARVLEIAKEGLKQRGYGEEIYLDPLNKRVVDRKAPADDRIKEFTNGGIHALIEATTLTPSYLY